MGMAFGEDENNEDMYCGLRAAKEMDALYGARTGTQRKTTT